MKILSVIGLGGVLVPFTCSALEDIDTPPHMVSYGIGQTLACLFIVWIVVGGIYLLGYLTGKESTDAE